MKWHFVWSCSTVAARLFHTPFTLVCGSYICCVIYRRWLVYTLCIHGDILATSANLSLQSVASTLAPRIHAVFALRRLQVVASGCYTVHDKTRDATWRHKCVVHNDRTMQSGIISDAFSRCRVAIHVCGMYVWRSAGCIGSALGVPRPHALIVRRRAAAQRHREASARSARLRAVLYAPCIQQVGLTDAQTDRHQWASSACVSLVDKWSWQQRYRYRLHQQLQLSCALACDRVTSSMTSSQQPWLLVTLTAAMLAGQCTDL